MENKDLANGCGTCKKIGPKSSMVLRVLQRKSKQRAKNQLRSKVDTEPEYLKELEKSAKAEKNKAPFVAA